MNSEFGGAAGVVYWWKIFCDCDSPAVHQDRYIRDPGIPNMVQHADQGGGVLWDSVVRPTSEEVVIKGVAGV